MKRIAINGFGRIGRAALKVISDTLEMEVVAVNDLLNLRNAAYLLKYDSVYGRFEKEVSTADDQLVVDGKAIHYSSIKNPLASIIDLAMTRVVDGDLVKIMAWYDNEWGFTNQMIRQIKEL